MGATNLRDRKMADTAFALTHAARALVADDGLAGFTVEQLCERVGVSRRTFFNYFASKDDAVLGVPVRRDPREVEDERAFTAGSGNLVDDLAEVAIGRFERMGLTSDVAEDMFAVLDREPRLLGRLLELSRVQERADMVLVEAREGMAAGDLRASMLVHLLGSIVRSSVEEFLGRSNTDTYRDVFARRLAAARAAFAA